MNSRSVSSIENMLSKLDLFSEKNLCKEIDKFAGRYMIHIYTKTNIRDLSPTNHFVIDFYHFMKWVFPLAPSMFVEPTSPSYYTYRSINHTWISFEDFLSESNEEGSESDKQQHGANLDVEGELREQSSKYEMTFSLERNGEQLFSTQELSSLVSIYNCLIQQHF